MSAILHSITTSIENDRIKINVNEWKYKTDNDKTFKQMRKLKNFNGDILEPYWESDYPKLTVVFCDNNWDNSNWDNSFEPSEEGKRELKEFINNELPQLIQEEKPNRVELYWEESENVINHITTLYEEDDSDDEEEEDDDEDDSDDEEEEDDSDDEEEEDEENCEEEIQDVIYLKVSVSNGEETETHYRCISKHKDICEYNMYINGDWDYEDWCKLKLDYSGEDMDGDVDEITEAVYNGRKE